jgi:hypothetical protein
MPFKKRCGYAVDCVNRLSKSFGEKELEGRRNSQVGWFCEDVANKESASQSHSFMRESRCLATAESLLKNTNENSVFLWRRHFSWCKERLRLEFEGTHGNVQTLVIEHAETPPAN